MNKGLTRRLALGALIVSIIAIAVAYASAFRPSGPPIWAAWLLALGIPLSLGGIMVLGAARGGREAGVGPLKIPFAFVTVVLAAGFGGALLLPATESPNSELWLGLPARAAIVIYGVGLMPTILLPIAYALTFESQTLRAEDIEQVRAFARGGASERKGLAGQAGSERVDGADVSTATDTRT